MPFFVCRRGILCLRAFGAFVGVLSCPGLNGAIRALEWHLSGGAPADGKWLKLGGGVTGGVTNWGYILRKLGLQNSCQRNREEGWQKAKIESKV